MVDKYSMKLSKKNIFYSIIIALLKFNFFKKISNLFINAYFIEKGYCFDWKYLMGKSSNDLFRGENIFISKFDNLKLKNCIDVGCNVGDFSKEILKNKNTNVVAFEPLPICWENLDKIHKKYNSRFINFEYALSNKDGFDYINFGDKNSSGLASLEKKINNIDYVDTANKNTLKIEIKKLNNLEVLVLNCIRIEPHYSHLNLKEALSLIKIIKPKKTYLTHISHHLGFHKEVEKNLPESVFLSYDGLKIDL